jgi:hypothetical protein
MIEIKQIDMTNPTETVRFCQSNEKNHLVVASYAFKETR